MEIDELLQGSNDMHLHTNPSPTPYRLDALETARLAQEAGMRAIVFKSHYYPFGYRLESQGDLGTDKLFTGQRLDNTGLYYYGARYYDPTIGRFISPDPVIKSLNPQNFNRYSYAFNNPLKYIDPNGLIAVGVGYRDDETYIIHEQNGQYKVAGTDLTESGLYGSLAELKEAWGGYIEQYGGSNYWEDWYGY